MEIIMSLYQPETPISSRGPEMIQEVIWVKSYSTLYLSFIWNKIQGH